MGQISFHFCVRATAQSSLCEARDRNRCDYSGFYGFTEDWRPVMQKKTQEHWVGRLLLHCHFNFLSYLFAFSSIYWFKNEYIVVLHRGIKLLYQSWLITDKLVRYFYFLSLSFLIYYNARWGVHYQKLNLKLNSVFKLIKIIKQIKINYKITHVFSCCCDKLWK